MMIDLLNKLQDQVGVTRSRPYQGKPPTPHHDAIDLLDRHAGIITKYQLDGSLTPVGARLRRLERHLFLHTAPPYFWLGAEAESLVA